ncbi:MAG TPA: carboxylating nicotinate-nucleotide diphosphorylase [Longimicrobiales bacterium]|nr:carboxylating nicotinate-nucleotide diphosphorylase [Longimicrobiales bacterium]
MTAERQKSRSRSTEAPQFLVSDEALRLIDMALGEDIGAGDWTTRWVVPARTRGSARIVAKAEGVVAGLAVASVVFMRLDPRVEIASSLSDGSLVQEGDVVCTIRGPARTILTGERTALNFLQRLSGIATMTRRYVDAIAGTDTRILDTRKTTPGWRTLEKAAVKAGGGENHRYGLFDMVLIKENHVSIAGGVAEAVKRVRDANTKGLRVEVEARNKDEVRAALDAGCDIVLLDNMDVQGIREAVRLVKQRAPQVKTEASGNMTLERVRAVAETGVDYISVGALTHSVTALDLSLLMQS